MYTIIHSTHRGPSGASRTHFTTASEPTTLVIAKSHEMAMEMLGRYKKDMTSRESIAKYVLAMWRDREDGLDVMLTPCEGRFTTEVRLRIQKAEVMGDMEG